jgi:hypothetical protein
VTSQCDIKLPKIDKTCNAKFKKIIKKIKIYAGKEAIAKVVQTAVVLPCEPVLVDFAPVRPAKSPWT